MTTSDIRVLRKANCPTLSGKSTLTYHVGSNAEDQLYLRVDSNNGGGFFSREWIALDAIADMLGKSPDHITSVTLSRLFERKSVNTPGFLLAVLKKEGLVEPVKGNSRRHQLGDIQAFVARIEQPASKPKTTRKKTSTRKKTAAKRRA
jgi:hypothetical protein